MAFFRFQLTSSLNGLKRFTNQSLSKVEKHPHHSIGHLFLYSGKTMRRKPNPEWSGRNIDILITWVTVVKTMSSVYLQYKHTE